jgi:hypothetical protein
MKCTNIVLFLLLITSSPLFAGTKVVGGGGVSFIGKPITTDGAKVGTGGIFLSQSLPKSSGGPDASFVITNEMLMKLKKLGIESLLLENGDIIDLNNGEEGEADFISGDGEN